MKKVLVGMFIALMGVFMVSCSNGGGIEKAKEILNELKADGANLDKEGLKAKVMDLGNAIKPEVAKMAEVAKELNEDPSKIADMADKLKDLQEFEEVMTDMDKVLEGLPAWKELEADEEFGKKFMELVGMPEN